jgi:hypothetical protein
MPAPLVSVVLPARNAGAFVADAVRSVLRQTLAEWELIVVDDASGDDTPAQLRGFADPRLRVVRRERATGLSDALNDGLGRAAAPLIARMDADDRCHPSRLARQADFMRRHPGVVVCGTWVRRFDGAGRRQLQRLPTDDPHIRAQMAFDNPFVHPSVMLRAETLRRHGLRYDTRSRHVEDYDLWSRLLAVGQGANLPAPLLDYRVHAQSVTGTAPAAMDERARPILDRALRFLGIEASPEELCFHRLLCTHRLAPAADAAPVLLRAEEWLLRIARVAAVRHESSFARAVRDRAACAWFGACYNLRAAGARLPARSWASPLLKGVAGGVRMRAVLALRTFAPAGGAERAGNGGAS